ncbi:MAG: hypothetical protein WC030_03370 [Candidatus Paceibacterota bacterium]
MKVLLQEWMTDRGHMVSLSLDQAQLDETIAELKAKDKGEPMDEPQEVEIPDNHGLVGLVRGETTFIHEDERDAITYPDE